ncbi:MAG TPA: hypothetical protein VKQ72_19150 [Aggregatilineales bacterium]|nr:hypothetical protein [Aggregatilineales bacterium]
MRAKAKSKKSRGATGARIVFRLNPNRPQEKVILEYLAQQSGAYQASASIKRALYEKVTGLDWDTNRPLAPAPVAVTEPVKVRKPADDEKKKKQIADIMAGLDDWTAAFS